MDEEVCLLCTERKQACFSFRKMTMAVDIGLRSRDNLTVGGVCLRHVASLGSCDRYFVVVDEICCREMMVGGTAEVQVRDPCSLRMLQVADRSVSVLMTLSDLEKRDARGQFFWWISVNDAHVV